MCFCIDSSDFLENSLGSWRPEEHHFCRGVLVVVIIVWDNNRVNYLLSAPDPAMTKQEHVVQQALPCSCFTFQLLRDQSTTSLSAFRNTWPLLKYAGEM
ncbi:hypothetical protein HPB50_018552 [Hyalomma asiaticum]|uniref:Uncharacterized protein n=1 Tax=Hyalomma asiaticum TaxID=266040 RepID=A0ACB7TM45_HYAAI|nr:hypothetical protein HPB50_018552 [Hyalomma asiaticum]